MRSRAKTEPVKGVVMDIQKARENVKALSERYGLAIDPDAKIEDISVGMHKPYIKTR